MLIDPTKMVSASAVQPDTGKDYIVVWCDNHCALSVGCRVRMVEDPESNNLLLSMHDLRLHSPDFDGDYVLLCPAEAVEGV